MPVNLATDNTPLPGIHDYQALVLGPLLEASKVLQHVRVIQTTGAQTHLPTGKAAATGWYAENAEITQTDDLIDEIVVTPRKVASLALLSNELAADTSPAAVETIGNIIVNSVAAEVDRAFFNGTGVAPQPLGLTAVAGVSTVSGTDSIPTMLADFADAIATIESEGGTATIAWMHPNDWSQLSQALTGHAAVAPIGAVERNVLGVTVETSRHVAEDTIWVADGNQIAAVVRSDGEVAVSTDARFTSDSTLVRVTSRINFAYPFPLTVCKVTQGA